MSPRRKRRTSLCALAALACVIAAPGCASWQGPRIDPSGERIFVWPGQTPAVAAPPPAFATTPAPTIPPPVITGPPTTTTVPIPPPTLPATTTTPPPVITTPLPPVGLPAGNMQAAPVYPDAGLQSAPPVITVPSASSPTGAAAPVATPPIAAVAVPPPPTVDAQFAFPAPTIAQAGHPLVLTTIVTRRSDGAPLTGWTVRYEVADATASVGSPGNTRVEVPTDANGRASIEISPTSIGPGIAVVNMTVVQPPTLTTDSTVTEVGRNSAAITWREGVPGAPAWGPTVAMGTGAPTSPWNTSAMPAPSLDTSTPSDSRSPSSDLTYGETRPPNRFEPPPSLSNQPPSASKTFAPPPKPAPEPKAEIVVEVRRRGPAQVEVGGSATFDVIVTNRGDGFARGIKLRDRFDPGLAHPQSKAGEYEIRYDRMQDLGPGESATVPLSFEVRSAGELCHEVTVSAEGVAPVTESGCITAIDARTTTPPTLEVLKIGPVQHYVGEQAKFRVVVKNTGDVPVTNVVVTDEYDAALEPRYNTDGAEQLPDGRFQWKIPLLAPTEKREFEVICACVTPSVGACSRVNVTADGNLLYADEKCVDILPLANTPPAAGVTPPPRTGNSNLQVTMRSTANPARVGQAMSLFVFVKNNGTQPERSVTLRVLVPQETTPDAAQVQPLGAAQVVGRDIRFSNIGDLQPGDEREFEIPLEVDRAGIVFFRAEVNATGWAHPVTTESNPIQIEAGAL